MSTRCILILLLFLVPASACDALGPAEGEDREYTATLVSRPSCDYCVTGMQEELTAAAYDADEQPVAGVPIQFTVTGGSATLAQPIVTTDANGLATTRVTFTHPGRLLIVPHRPEAPPVAPMILGRWIFAGPPTLSFASDSLVLDRPACTTRSRGMVHLTVDGGPPPREARPWINPQLVVTDTLVASSASWTVSTPEELRVEVRGPGRALLVMSLGGVADTLVLVAPPMQVTDVNLLFRTSTLLGVGDTIEVAPIAYTDCAEGGQRILPWVTPTMGNLSPEVIGLEPPSGTVVGRSVGTGLVAVRHGDLSRNAPVHVSDWVLAPADTTIVRGDSLGYRTSVRHPGDTQYRPGWAAGRFVSSDTTVAVVHPITGIARGVRPGVAQVTAVLTGSHGRDTNIRRTSVLRVRDP